ncbi:MAG: hypothetical protein Q6360_13145 [Candidatus Brocadiales bacterium]|nr:hypothetical protein [Candidatus Brocadiales bacterium]
MQIAPSYVAGVVAVVVSLQSILGLSFTSDQWTAAIVVVCGIVVAVRQVLNGRSSWFGVRK